MGKQQEPSISFYVAGCMEYENYAELYENLTLAQAVDIFMRIRKRNCANIPGIGFRLEDSSISDYAGMNWPLYVGNKIAREDIALIPAYENHPLVQQAVEEMENYIPKLQRELKRSNQMER